MTRVTAAQFLLVLGCAAHTTASAQACPSAPSYRAPDWASDFDGGRTPAEGEAMARVARFDAELARAAPGRAATGELTRQLAEAHRDLYRVTGDEGELREAIRIFATTVRDWPDQPHIDRVLFLLGWGLDQLSQRQRARQVYHRLIRDHPTSPYVALCYLSFADYYWGEGDFRAARQFYARAVTLDAGLPSAYAAYMAAWSAHRLGASEEARESAGGARQALDSLAHAGAGALREGLRRDACALER